MNPRNAGRSNDAKRTEENPCSRTPRFYAGFGVDDIPAAKAFYADKLGVRVIEIDDGLLSLQAGNGYSVLAYIRPGHVPAEHTILNFPVDDIESTVDRLAKAGVTFERYDDEPIKTNEKGIAHPGPGRPGSGIPPATSCPLSRNSDHSPAAGSGANKSTLLPSGSRTVA